MSPLNSSIVNAMPMAEPKNPDRYWPYHNNCSKLSRIRISKFHCNGNETHSSMKHVCVERLSITKNGSESLTEEPEAFSIDSGDQVL